jgi:hypothetical protein
MTMLIEEAYMSEEVRHPSLTLADAQQKARSTIQQLQAIANPRARMSLEQLAEQVDGASSDRLVTIIREAMAMMRLVEKVNPQVVADIYARNWT